MTAFAFFGSCALCFAAGLLLGCMAGLKGRGRP